MLPEDEDDVTAQAPDGEELGPPDPAAKFGEPDPEARLADPEADLPNVPEPPTPPSAEVDAPPELLKGFWTTVAVFNVALLALSLGALMVAFDVHRALGVGALAVGLLSLARGFLKYRALDERNWSATADAEADANDGGTRGPE